MNTENDSDGKTMKSQCVNMQIKKGEFCQKINNSFIILVTLELDGRSGVVL